MATTQHSLQSISLEDIFSASRRNLISFDSPDLPSNIRAIKVSALNPDTLKQAVKLLRGPVQTVQIETSDVPPELVGYPHRLMVETGRFSLNVEIVSSQTMRPTQRWEITQGLNGLFQTRAIA